MPKKMSAKAAQPRRSIFGSMRQRKLAAEEASDRTTARKSYTQALSPFEREVNRKVRMGESLSRKEKAAQDRIQRKLKARQDVRQGKRSTYG